MVMSMTTSSGAAAAAAATTGTPPVGVGGPDLDIRLDQPLIPWDRPVASTTKARLPGTNSASGRSFVASLLALVQSDMFRSAMIAFLTAMTLTIVIRILMATASTTDDDGTTSSSSSSSYSPSQQLRPARKLFRWMASNMEFYLKWTRGRCTRFWTKLKRSLWDTEGVPMNFDNVMDAIDSGIAMVGGAAGGGWGVCTLSSKRRMGKSSYVQYDFELPRADNTLSTLALGQQLSLCCLDDEDRVVKDDFYLLSPRSTKGYFSIVTPDGSREDGRVDFARVLNSEIMVGDEVAIRPGPTTLDYRGPYLPVTDMVYITSGLGVVPIVDQVRAVLPSGSSSVRSLSVIWINERSRDFAIALDTLEEEYYKYGKLSVSCVVAPPSASGSSIVQGTVPLESNEEVEASVPEFQPGTMAVVSGPPGFREAARTYLLDRSYPDSCICVLP